MILQPRCTILKPVGSSDQSNRQASPSRNPVVCVRNMIGLLPRVCVRHIIVLRHDCAEAFWPRSDINTLTSMSDNRGCGMNEIIEMKISSSSSSCRLGLGHIVSRCQRTMLGFWPLFHGDCMTQTSANTFPSGSWPSASISHSETINDFIGAVCYVCVGAGCLRRSKMFACMG